MEKVFWLMWLSDIAGSIGIVGVACLIVLGLCIVAMTFLVAADDDPGAYRRGMRVAWWVAVPLAVACVTPNPRTIQILAVTSAAEAAASTKLGAKSLEAIDALLDKVIKESKK